ncbi:glycosyltransferase [Sulfurisoma sediminicola]|uniref:Glycosyltransferase involved in cell wall biosynthesis n=1 Tax=Sulfurisoma sediminicola TaxID=1381557 RepID=A0A497XLY3_9PROT|nr:glycosyltransferase [Sulfurisoma sediminicola]RLJ68315.1 glycosyltransferase involved in cell wall biosynthesis [Sulfurisoma sediminicola]
MTRVLVLDTGKEWGGGTNSLLELLKRIDRKRFDISACFYHDYARGEGSSISRELAALGIPFTRLPDLRQPLWAKLAKELARGLLGWHRGLRARAVFAIERAWRIEPRAAQVEQLLREGGHGLLYLNNQPSSNLEGYLAGEVAGVPVVQHCRIDAALNAAEIAATNRMARAVICVSQGVADSLRAQGIDAGRIVVVHNAIDGAQPLPTPQPLPQVPTGALVVGTVGQLVKRKSVDDLLHALKKLGGSGTAADLPAPTTGTPLHALIVGAGPEEQALRSLASELGLADRVHFAGFQREPLPWLAAMDIFVLASSKEGLPRVILEAMLLGKPVVAARAVGSTELVSDGDTGFLYAHGDVAALAARIDELAGNAALRARLGQVGRTRVLAEFSIEGYVAGVERVLAAAAGATA